MANVGDILNDNQFFRNVVDTPKEGTEQDKKREELKGVMEKGKAHLLAHKWTHGRVDKASDEIINKTYDEYKQCELNEKGEKTARALAKHAINLYSNGIFQFVKIRDIKKLRQDIEDDPVIKDHMPALGSHLVYTFGDYLVLILVAVHTVNNVDFHNEPENESYEGEGP